MVESADRALSPFYSCNLLLQPQGLSCSYGATQMVWLTIDSGWIFQGLLYLCRDEIKSNGDTPRLDMGKEEKKSVWTSKASRHNDKSRGMCKREYLLAEIVLIGLD